MGNLVGSQQDCQDPLHPSLGSGECFIGFENKSNICYANSILQALYHQKTFREHILQYKQLDKGDNPLIVFQEIFRTIQSNKKKVGVLSTKKLMSYVRKNNELFQGEYHQDSHEFLIWILNQMNDLLIKEKKMQNQDPKTKTWLQQLFEGIITNKTECTKCKNITLVDEPFLDLSLNLEENSSINYCLKKFENVEIMDGNDKFHCDKCKGLQVANKMTYIKHIPQILIIHLKRFKYIEKHHRMEKLNWKIAFPFEIRIKGQQDSSPQLYKLYAVIVHSGQGLQFGHYVSIIRINDRWFQFDDETISATDERQLYSIFGSQTNTSSAYMLFYHKIEIKHNNGNL